MRLASGARGGGSEARLLIMVSALVLVVGAFASALPASASDDAPVGAVLSVGAQGCADQSEDDCEEAPLSVVVTAQGSVARAYSWGVEKVADTTIRSTNSSGTATFRYTVTARAGAMTESGRELAGEVTVTNPNTGGEGAITADVTVATTLGGGSSCTVIGGQDAVVPPSDRGPGQATLPYTCTFTSTPASSGDVAATVTWDPAGEASTASTGATTPATFVVTSETNRTVAVVDDATVPGQRVVLDPSVTWSPGLVKTYTYDLALTGGAPGDCTPYVNTVMIDQPSGSDPSASVPVEACVPEILPAQAFGQATGSVIAGCQGTVRARVSNRTRGAVTYRLRVGTRVHRIVVKALRHKMFVTSGRAGAKVTLKVGATRLDRIRIPRRCQAPVSLPDTGLRATSG